MEQFIKEIEENEQEERTGFVIDNDQKADWAVRRIAELEADTQKWKDYYKAQSERVAQSNQQSIDYFTALLESYFMSTDQPKKHCDTRQSRQSVL